MLCGTKLCGPVFFTEDKLVATEFFHFFFIPLCPLNSLWIQRSSLNGTGCLCCNRRFKYEPLKDFVPRSVLWGYLQGVIYLAAVILATLGIIFIRDEGNVSTEFVLMLIAMFVGPWLIYGVLYTLFKSSPDVAQLSQLQMLVSFELDKTHRTPREKASKSLSNVKIVIPPTLLRCLICHRVLTDPVTFCPHCGTKM
jgi:hypothetical protein